MKKIVLVKRYIGEDVWFEIEDIELEKTILENYYNDVDSLLVPGMKFRTSFAEYEVE